MHNRPCARGGQMEFTRVSLMLTVFRQVSHIYLGVGIQPRPPAVRGARAKTPLDSETEDANGFGTRNSSHWLRGTVLNRYRKQISKESCNLPSFKDYPSTLRP